MTDLPVAPDLVGIVVRDLTDHQWPKDIYFLISFREPQEFIFREEIADLTRQYTNLHVFVTMSRPDETWTGRHGRISKELIVDAVPDVTTHRYHICGPEPMMADVQSMLRELAVPREQVKHEAFGNIQNRGIDW